MNSTQNIISISIIKYPFNSNLQPEALNLIEAVDIRKLPTLISQSENWYATHNCTNCNKLVYFGFKKDKDQFLKITNCSHYGILTDKYFSLQKLEKVKSFFTSLKINKTNGVSYLALKGMDETVGNSVATIYLYKCHYCAQQYSFSNTIIVSDDYKNPNSILIDKFYIEEIVVCSQDLTDNLLTIEKWLIV